MPAAFTGVYGFKPTQGRLTHTRGTIVKTNGFSVLTGHFFGTAGPLARSVRDCIEFFKVQCVDKAHLLDPFYGTMPFN